MLIPLLPLAFTLADEGKKARHGTRVSSLAEVPANGPGKSRRTALGLDRPEDFEPEKQVVY